MSVEQSKVVDFVSIKPSTGELVLTISDHLPWEKDRAHLLLLQEKLNNYLAFIESGEIFQSYPDAKGRSIVIDVVSENPIDVEGKDFFARAALIVKDAGFKLTYRQLGEQAS